MITHRGTISRVYLPPDANTLLSVADSCMRSWSCVNLVVIDKQPQLQWLSMDDAIEHCAQGAGVWPWAGNEDGRTDPDIVLACAGDVVTMETVAAAEIPRERLPRFTTRVVNVVDLMTLARPAIHQLVHGRPDTDRFHVHGFIEEGTTTPFDMVVRNRASRYHLVMDALDRARRTLAGATGLRAWCEQQLVRHEQYVVEHLQDMPEVRDWSLGDWAEQ